MIAARNNLAMTSSNTDSDCEHLRGAQMLLLLFVREGTMQKNPLLMRLLIGCTHERSNWSNAYKLVLPMSIFSLTLESAVLYAEPTLCAHWSSPALLLGPSLNAYSLFFFFFSFQISCGNITLNYVFKDRDFSLRMNEGVATTPYFSAHIIQKKCG